LQPISFAVSPALWRALAVQFPHCAMHPELAGDLQPVAIEKTNPHRHGDGPSRFSTPEDSKVGTGAKDPKSPHYSPYHLIGDPEPNPKNKGRGHP
jgi:hypothetical protein